MHFEFFIIFPCPKFLSLILARSTASLDYIFSISRIKYMRGLFFSLPVWGHTLPTLPVCRELTRRGVEMIYYSTDKFRKVIEGHGIAFKRYPYGNDFYSALEDKLVQCLRSRGLTDFWLAILEYTEKFITSGIEDIEKTKPDFLIHDAMVLGGKIAALKTNTPAICSVPIGLMNGRMTLRTPYLWKFTLKGASQFGKYINVARRLCKTFGVRKSIFKDIIYNREKLNIVYTSRYFQPFERFFGEEYKFIGASIDEEQEEGNREAKENIIYISLGTLFDRLDNFFEICFEAFKGMDYHVILSLGGRLTQTHFTHLPSHFQVETFVDQKAILKRAKLFITHGGLNSVSEGMYYQTPLVMIPSTLEQELNARRVERLGAGIMIDRSAVTPQILAMAAKKVLHEGAYVSSAEKIRQSFLTSGGYRKAADEILSFLNKGVMHP
ncbi:MAG: macrolide family glycosyltransferase [Patescibacteria group bacterium]